METRLENLRNLLLQHELDGLIVSNKENRFYLSGFTGTSALFLITGTEKIIVTDFRYFEQLKEQAPTFQVIDHKGKSLTALSEKIKQLGLKRVGFEGAYFPSKDYLTLSELLPNYTTLMVTENLVEQLRMIKTPEEILIMREAARLTDETFEYFLSILAPGKTEQELAAQVDAYLRKIGGSGSAFETIVASGWRSALPHGHASHKVIEKNELVTLDFGIVYQHYYSDMTRTVATGSVPTELKEIYQIVQAAGEKGLAFVKTGVSGRELDASCRNEIEAAGYGAYFGHGTGHGIGLSCHEFPDINQSSEIKLQENMCFTIEPGIYLPGVGGVRIEDDILIQPNGEAVALTKSTRDWIECS